MDHKLYGSSLMITYEGKEKAKKRGKYYDVRIVDFGNACPTNDAKYDDYGFLFGLTNLLNMLNDLMPEHPKQDGCYS